MKSELFTIYGARKAQKSERVNVSIVTGEGDKKQWGTISIALNGSGKTKATIKEDKNGNAYVLIKVPMLVDTKKEEVKDDLANEEVPFLNMIL